MNGGSTVSGILLANQGSIVLIARLTNAGMAFLACRVSWRESIYSSVRNPSREHREDRQAYQRWDGFFGMQNVLARVNLFKRKEPGRRIRYNAG